MKIYNSPRRLFCESAESLIGILFSLPWLFEAKGRIGFILTGIIILMGFILFEVFAIIKYFRDISVISVEKIVQIVNKKVVRELRRDDIRQIIFLYEPKGNLNHKIIIDDGSYNSKRNLYVNIKDCMREKSNVTFCFFDYTKARKEYLEKIWPEIQIEKHIIYGDLT